MDKLFLANKPLLR